MATRYDVIVIGSGFGGAVTGCRLAEKGYKVLILERGRRWTSDTYPSKTKRDWIWSHERPEHANGWIDLRVFPGMAVAQGAAVGGGSLIYASISVEAPPKVFEANWPREVTWAELKPYYDAVKKFMNIQKMPTAQWNPRTVLMKEAADKTGHGDRFEMLDMAVSFDPDLVLDLTHPPAETQSKTFVNAQGVTQGYCIHKGYCDIGCPVYAKNTLDLNYIPWAEKHGAEVRPLHLVTDIAPTSGGYRVSFDRLEPGQRIGGTETARIVILAAGSLGSTELLLRCRDVNRTLPDVSPFLGRNWTSNGDFLTPALYADRKLYPALGPTISSAINFLDRTQDRQSFWIEDGGMPHLFGGLFRTTHHRLATALGVEALVESIHARLRALDPIDGVMPWFAQGVDGGDGALELKRRWWLLGARRLHLSWDVRRSMPVFEAIVNMHKKLSAATGGVPLVPPTWTISHELVTPHPLGGCNMGDTPTNGVVDHRGEVFGYNNLYVADGAIIPTPLGVNPSRTIAALAERIAKLIIQRG